MQRICHIQGEVKDYLAQPDCLVNQETRKCPFCDQRDHDHALWLHAWYWRWALFPDPQEPYKLPIRRLYCPHVRRTVSLLPDFCIPRRQHGPAILAIFLQLLVAGKGLLHGLRKARANAPCHAVAQSLRDGFLRRAVNIRAYLARRHRRVIEPPDKVPKDRRHLAELYLGLVAGFNCPQAAFIFHNACFHQSFREPLA